MPFGSVRLVPGIDIEKTPTLNTTGIASGNLIRWRDGLVEKIGGWQKFYASNISSIPRDLKAWQDLNTTNHLAVGATTKLLVITGGVASDITPQTTTTNSAPQFSTTSGSDIITIIDPNITGVSSNNSVFLATPVSVGGLLLQGLYAVYSVLTTNTYEIRAAANATSDATNGGAVPIFNTVLGSSTVTVNEPNHGQVAGNDVSYLVSSSVGGLTISGTYLVQSIIDGNNYTINASGNATSGTSGAMNGGNVRFVYYIALGPTPVSGSPYGAGAYGSGAYGSGAIVPPSPGTPITALDWTSGNWGEILLECPQGGAIYQWSPETGLTTAQVVANAPIANSGIFVAMPLQILVAYGSSFAGVAEPLQLNWSTDGDFTEWTPSSTNQAGGYTIPTGSKIVGGVQGPQQGLIWTDIDLYAMMYIGPPNVFGFSKIMSGCGLIGSHAMGVLGNAVYWMSQEQIFVMPAGGAPQSLPCTVWDYIYQNLDMANAYKIRCKPNSNFATVGWEFPSASGGSGENDSYIEYNVIEREWSTGRYPVTGRSAWIDQSVFGPPLAGTPSGLIYQHEEGYNADGVAMNPTFTTGYFVVGEGEDFYFIDQFIPDFKYGLQGGSQSAQLQITLNVVNYPNDTPTVLGPYTVSQASNYVSTRLRGRQVSMTAQSNDLGSFWRLGLMRYRFSTVGRR